MYDKKEFDEYSNYDDRDIQHGKAAPKMGRSNKEEYGKEKNIENLFSKKNTNNNNPSNK